MKTLIVGTGVIGVIYGWALQRFTAHAADSLQEARENFNNIMQTANELSFDMPHTKAVGTYLQQS